MSRRLLLLACLLPLTAAAQQIHTYTESESGNNRLPLGYPVPRAVASLTPIDGFRDHASLHARLQALALEHDDVAAHRVGQTHHGRDVWAYALSSPSAVDREGRAKAAFFINASTHAREWAAPEVGVGLVERMAEGADDGGLVRYLLDHTRLVIIPVHNVDGLLQTQRNPDQVIIGQDPRVPNIWPRDGRMRRKNMRNVDEDLLTFADHLGGIDLNRNHPPFWATSVGPSGSSNNPAELTFHGAEPHSEAESQALRAAAALAPESRIRLGIDVHSFSRVFFSTNTGRERLNAIQTGLLQIVAGHHLEVPTANGSPNGRFYSDVRDPPNRGIGTAAEYFGFTWLVPSWTLELEPGGTGAREYGGLGVSHDGFILPDSQARRVREAWAESHLVAFYFMAGAPHLARVRLHDAADGTLLEERRWEWNPQTLRRELVTDTRTTLLPGRQVRAELAFSKPMRHRRDGAAESLPGVQVPLRPQVWLVRGSDRQPLDTGGGTWLDRDGWRYRDDSYAFEFTLPEQPGAFGLEVRAVDMVGIDLDADPSTPVDWEQGAWSGWEDETGVAGDRGGPDANFLSEVVDGVGSAGVSVVHVPAVVGEGDVLRVRLNRAQADGAPILLAAVAPGGPYPAGSVAEAAWGAQETGERLLAIPVDDDMLVQGDRVASFAISRIDADGMAQTFAQVSAEVLDNDDQARAVLSAVAPNGFALGWAMAAGATRPVDLVLRRGSHAVPIHDGGSPPNDLPLLAGALRVFGNGAELRLPSRGERPPLRFAAEAQLTLQALRLVSSGEIVSARPDPQPMVSGEGMLQLSRVEIDAGAAEAILPALLQADRIEIERSVLRAAETERLVVGGDGGIRVAASSLFDNEVALGLFAATGAIELTAVSLLGNRSGRGLLGDVAQLGGSLLQGNQASTDGSHEPACAPAMQSLGFNVHDGTDCPLTAGGDRSGVSLGLPAPAEDSTWVAPAGVAVDIGGTCGLVDQRGAPRPQTLEPDDAPRCDAGAVELGVNPYRGVWQPSRPGHGVDLQTAGNQLLLAWYTYDDDGQPTAYQALAPLTGPRWRAELQRSRRDPASGEVLPPARVGEVGIDFASDTVATLRWRFDARGVDGSETIRAFAFSPGAPAVEVTGLWFPPAEPGYGATVTRRGEVTAVGLYYYDGSGALRWALGTGHGGSADDIEMLSYTGFCPDCDAQAMPIAAQPAGRLLFHFLTPRRARIDTALSYPGPAGGAWQRMRAAFVPLNDPVDNREALGDD